MACRQHQHQKNLKITFSKHLSVFPAVKSSMIFYPEPSKKAENARTQLGNRKTGELLRQKKVV